MLSGVVVAAATNPANAQVIQDQLNPGANAWVQALALQADGKLLLGGDFGQLGPIDGGVHSVSKLARLNVDGGFDTSFADGSINGWVYSIAPLPNGQILIGGRFSSVFSQARTGVARLHPNGTLDLAFLPPTIDAHGDGNRVFRVLPLATGQTLIGGHFTNIGGSGRAKLARLHNNGLLDTSYPPVVLGSTSQWIWHLAEQADGKILIGGGFNQINGVTRYNLARLNADGTLDTGFTAGVRLGGGGSVSTIAVQPDGRIVVAGNFDDAIPTSGSSMNVGHIARFNVDGTLDYAFSDAGADVNASIDWMHRQIDGRLLIGGSFTEAAIYPPAVSVPRNRVARLLPSGQPDPDFAPPPINGPVGTLLAQADDRVVIGGNFTQVAGVQRNRIARLVQVEPQDGIAQIAAGSAHTCALTTTGAVKCWGSNHNGQLGDGSMRDSLLPVAVQGLGSGVKAISAGEGHSCAVLNNGAMKCWGWNLYGQLGDGTQIQRPLPVTVVALGGGVEAAASGAAHSCALTVTGSVKCWGSNDRGQLGDGTTTDRPTPGDVLMLGANVQSIVAAGAGDHSCAITAAGGAKCWGWNQTGQLGDGTTTLRTLPVDVSTLGSGVQSMAAGGLHSCAITNSDQLKCWGSNTQGQLGTGVAGSSHVPADVFISGGDPVMVATGGEHTCAISDTGSLWCWGGNFAGQLGNNSTSNAFTPILVGLFAGDALALGLGTEMTCAIATGDRQVGCWGRNANGQLGNGTTTNALTPQPVLVPTPPAIIFRNGFN